MSSLADLLRQREQLDVEIERIRHAEKQAVIESLRALIATYQIDIHKTLGATRAAAKATTGSLPAKYRNTETGESWTGRGPRPKWLKRALESGKDLAAFMV